MQNKVFEQELDVAKFQREKIKDIVSRSSSVNQELDGLEEQVRKLLEQSNLTKNQINERKEIEKDTMGIGDLNQDSSVNRDFSELLQAAHAKGFIKVEIEDIATEYEIESVDQMLRGYYKEYTDQYKLDKWDYAIAGIIGTIAALTDYFLVTKVNLKLGQVTPGKLKSGVEELWEKILPHEKIKELEQKYKVPYDIPINTSKLSQEVLGLHPNYHRFQSLGHDPILGFIFGVMDIMKGTMTAIDGNGRIIIQSTGNDTKNIIEAIITQFGHLLSDVNTPSKTGKVLSIPAPLMPLLQLIQYGSIEYNGKRLTVAELSKKMYYDGYNFNHFIGMSIPVLIIEILMRMSYVIKDMFLVKELKIANISTKNNPKLDILLGVGNGILFAENIGKLVITKNPFAINYVSWLATIKYGFKTLKWIAYDREIGKMDYAQEYVDSGWNELLRSMDQMETTDEVYYIK